jgi:hypothetical protein
VHEPVQCGFERFDRRQLPFHERDIVLAARQPAGRRRGDAIVAAAMQPKLVMGAIGADQEDAMRLRAAGQIDHRIDDPVLRGHGFDLAHDDSPINENLRVEGNSR